MTGDATGAEAGEEADVDLVGVGIGPFNLSLAALADGVDGLTHPVPRRPAGVQLAPRADVRRTPACRCRSWPTWCRSSTRRAGGRSWPTSATTTGCSPSTSPSGSTSRAASTTTTAGGSAPGSASCRFGARVEAVSWDAARRAVRRRVPDPGDPGTRRAAAPVTARNVVLGRRHRAGGAGAARAPGRRPRVPRRGVPRPPRRAGRRAGRHRGRLRPVRRRGVPRPAAPRRRRPAGG